MIWQKKKRSNHGDNWLQPNTKVRMHWMVFTIEAIEFKIDEKKKLQSTKMEKRKGGEREGDSRETWKYVVMEDNVQAEPELK